MSGDKTIPMVCLEARLQEFTWLSENTVGKKVIAYYHNMMQQLAHKWI